MRFGKELPLPDFWWEGRVGANQQPNIINPSNSPTNTFTRNSPKRVRNKNGILERVENNIPAFEYDENGNYLGYLPESARTNLFQRSEEFDDGYWVKSGTSSVSANVSIAPNGEQTADRFTPTANQDFIRRNISVPGGIYTLSIFAKADGHNVFEITMSNVDTLAINVSATVNLVNMTVTSLINATDSKIEQLDNGWVRVSVTGARPSALTRFGVRLTSWVSGSILFWGAQLEAGSFASTYIKTTDATVTRPADILTFTDASDFIGQSEGVIYAEVDLRYFGTLFNLSKDDDSPAVRNGNRIALDYNVGNSLAYRIINNASTIVNRSTSIATGMSKIIITYALSGASFVVNGTVISADTVSAIPDMGRIYLGQGVFDSAQPQSPIRSVRLWKTADWCTDEVAQQLTTL